MILPEWLFKAEQPPNKNKFEKVYNPKIVKQIARENIKINDKELAKEMINPYYFIDENLKIGFKINLESHKVNHVNSLLNMIPKFPDSGIQTRYINEILKEMTTSYGRLLNQFRFKISYNNFSEHL